MTYNADGRERVPLPAHVPLDHVVDFDYINPEGLDEGTVYTALKRLHDGPDILWTPRNGGHWIVTRAEDVRWVQETYEIFSHEDFAIPRRSMRIDMPPLTVDPPRHARYRAVLNPFFTPSRVAALADKARTLAVELIEGLKPKGRCEFVEDFAQVLPVVMFLGIVNLPVDRRKEFIALHEAYAHATDNATRDRHLAPVIAYLRQVLDERYTKPGDDLMSAIAAWRNNPRFGGEHEVTGMAMLVFSGGLDTVASMLSFTAWHLAEHPEHRRRLREEPDIVPRAAEEYIRRHGLSNTGRLIKKDVTRKGVTMQANEMVMVSIGLSGLDERAYPDPFKVDFDRPEIFAKGKPAHNTFGNGPHKCVGAPLARAELQIFLEEWLKRIPDFRLDPAHRPVSRMGGVNGVNSLHLVWDT
ncbi:MAG: cytochrome P450 [Burkholderiales bacterium]